MVTELEGVLARPKFGLDPAVVHVLVRDIEAMATVVYPTIFHRIVLEDPADNMVADCAVEARADLIFSGDHRLIGFGEMCGIRVVTHAGIAELLASRYNPHPEERARSEAPPTESSGPPRQPAAGRAGQ